MCLRSIEPPLLPNPCYKLAFCPPSLSSLVQYRFSLFLSNCFCVGCGWRKNKTPKGGRKKLNFLWVAEKHTLLQALVCAWACAACKCVCFCVLASHANNFSNFIFHFSQSFISLVCKSINF